MPRLVLVFCSLFMPLAAVAHTAVVAHTDSHREATQQLMEVMRADEVIDQMHSLLEPMLMEVADDMEMSPRQREIYETQTARMIQIMREEMNWSKMEPYMLEAYMNVFDEQEIRDIIVFYRTPTGQKLLDRMPQLMEESMRVTQRMMQDFAPRLQALQEELRIELASAE